MFGGALGGTPLGGGAGFGSSMGSGGFDVPMAGAEAAPVVPSIQVLPSFVFIDDNSPTCLALVFESLLRAGLTDAEVAGLQVTTTAHTGVSGGTIVWQDEWGMKVEFVAVMGPGDSITTETFPDDNWHLGADMVIFDNPAEYMPAGASGFASSP